MDKYGITSTLISQYVGRTAFDRGKSYYRSGRVVAASYTANLDTANILDIFATVKGTRRYEVGIRLGSKGGKRYVAAANCSCPVGVRCKHIAAVLLYAQKKMIDDVQEAEVVSRPSAWRQAFSSFAGANEDKQATGSIGLLFELQHTTTTRGKYHNAAQVTKPTSSGPLKLGVRPVMLGASGRWVSASLSWSSVAEGWSRVNLRATHQKWFKEIWAVYCITKNAGHYYDASKWLYLDDFVSGNVWSLLRQGYELGIPFIHADSAQTKLGLTTEPFRPVMSVTGNKRGDLKITPELFVKDHRADVSSLRFFGDPAVGVYAWQSQASTLKEARPFLAPLSQPLDSQLQKQVLAKTTTTIPSAEVSDFTQHYYPLLTRQLPVVTDGVVLLPELGVPQLLMRVSPKNVTHVEVDLSWRYTAGDQVKVMPLRAGAVQSGNIIRTEKEEQRILASFANIVNQQHAFFDDTGDIKQATILRSMAAVGFATVQLPQLQTQSDVAVEIDGDLPDYEEFVDEPLVQVGTSETTGSTDWFDLQVSLKLGDHEVPMEQILIALGSNEPYLLLDNGVFFRLDHPKLVQLKRMVEEARSLQDKESDGLKLSKFQAGLWEELAALGVVTEQAAAWRQSLQGLLDVAFIPKIKTPVALKATLRPYQEQGFAWLAFLYEHRLGGILADDMGLGKTLQTLALFVHIRRQTPAAERLPQLVIAPTSVAANWALEFAQFAPSLKVVHLQQTVGKAKRSLASQIKRADIVISSYALCRLDEDHYLEQLWDVIVLDEAQFVKNHQSKGYQVARKLQARLKIALTGTPLENNLMELWSLLSIVAPGLFPSPKHFADFYQKPIERQNNKELLSQLRQRVRPLMLRRTKDRVVKELPPKIEQTLELELHKDHKRVYDIYLQRERQRVLGMLGDFDKNRFAVLKAITTLRQLSLDPKLVDAQKYKNVPSTKLDGLLEQLDEVLSEGHRALVFSQFTSFLATVRQALDKRKIHYLYLDGATKKRGELLKEFKTTDVPLFLISLKSGGFGLNLTEADYCFLTDPWWNPAVEQQAVDRAHRIGQTKSVMVYRLISKGTIEEKVTALKARKAALFSSVLDEGELFSSAITASDIRSLFE